MTRLIMPTTEKALLIHLCKAYRALYPSSKGFKDEWIMANEKKQIDIWGFRYMIHRLAGYYNLIRERKGLRMLPYAWWNYKEDKYIKITPSIPFPKRFGGYDLED